MIPELLQYTILGVLVILTLIPLSEDERLEERSERRHVNRLADRSRRGRTNKRRSWGCYQK